MLGGFKVLVCKTACGQVFESQVGVTCMQGQGICKDRSKICNERCVRIAIGLSPLPGRMKLLLLLKMRVSNSTAHIAT